MGKRTSRYDKMRRGLGAAIGLKLAAKGMTRRQLSDAAGVDERQVARVIAGRSGLSLQSLDRVAVALGCSASDLLAAPPTV